MRPKAPGRVLIVSAEESAEEIRSRIYYAARAAGLRDLPTDAIDIIDIHDAHMPLLTKEATPTEHAIGLARLAKERGPYVLTIVDPLARISGASIDADNVAASALVTALEAVATSARGLVLGSHHTSQTARRMNLKDATAIRGATGLGDAARMVMVLTVEQVDHGDRALDVHLGEVVEITRAKANHVGRWEPIRMRRDDHGALVPLDSRDEAMVDAARKAADPRERKAKARDDAGRARISQVADAVVVALREAPGGLTYRGLRGAVVKAMPGGCGDPVLGAALATLADLVSTRPGPRGATLHCLCEDDR